MKTSNILMLSGLLLFVGSLAAYDFGLKAQYLQMKEAGMVNYYKNNRFNNYTKIELSNFDKIDIRAANYLGAAIEYGDKQAVYIRKRAEKMIAVNEQNNSLTIDLSQAGKAEKYIDYNQSVVIILPRLSGLKTSSFSDVKSSSGDPKTQTRNNAFSRTDISGFKQDSLALTIGSFTSVNLSKNELKFFNAEIGDSNGDANLRINSDNNIGSIKIDVLNKSTVDLLDGDIENLDYNISDGAIISLRGATIQKLKNRHE